MKNQANVVIKKGRHSRKPLSGIFRVLSLYVNQAKCLFINNAYVEDPRQRHSGMTTYFTTAGGFTLIELLVIVLIIGILVAVAVPQYQKAVLKSRFATVKEMIHSLANAEELYYLANGEYTADFEALDISLPPSENEETNGETDTTRTFDNWQCIIHSTAYVYCGIMQSDNKRVGLQIYMKHVNHDQRGQRWCVASNVDLTSLPNQICKSETKQESPNAHYSGATWIVWVY